MTIHTNTHTNTYTYIHTLSFQSRLICRTDFIRFALHTLRMRDAIVQTLLLFSCADENADANADADEQENENENANKGMLTDNGHGVPCIFY